MTSRDFCFWAQGFFELANPKEMTADQVRMFRNHLNLVFKHEIDPVYSSDPKVQQEMQEVHDGVIVPNVVTPTPNPINVKPSWGEYDHDNGLLRC